MKTLTKLFVAIVAAAFTLATANAQTMYVIKNGSIAYQSAVSEIDSIIFYEPVFDGVLINGVVWATRNVAAPGHFADSPQDPGMFYQWNRSTGWSATDPAYTIDATGTRNDSPTWNSSDATGTTWATTNNVCPTGWRVPTNAELTALANAGSTWIANGLTFGTAPNQIFLPAAGYRYLSSSSLDGAGSYGYYWSSRPTGTYSYYLYFTSSYVDPGYSDYRANGFSVRCVAE
jgi:uncharacterized protein (TIGR02145 family)